MNTTGTPRYLMNLCSWLAAIEKYIITKDCNEPVNFKLKFIDTKFDRFIERKNKPIEQTKILFVVNDSSSVYEQKVYFNKVIYLFCTNYFFERCEYKE